jgi:predicted nucleic acid-binding protein
MLAYEISRLITDPRYEHVQLSEPFIFFRNRSRIAEQDRMFIRRLRLESPFDLSVIILAVPSAIGAIWGIVQICEKVSNWPLNRRKLRAEVEKLERENADMASAHDSVIRGADQFNRQLHRRSGEHAYDIVLKRLSKSPIIVVNLEIKVLERLEKK